MCNSFNCIRDVKTNIAIFNETAESDIDHFHAKSVPVNGGIAPVLEARAAAEAVHDPAADQGDEAAETSAAEAVEVADETAVVEAEEVLR